MLGRIDTAFKDLLRSADHQRRNLTAQRLFSTVYFLLDVGSGRFELTLTFSTGVFFCLIEKKNTNQNAPAQ